MKRTVKKGFTIVELVIVIAVVAILAAVLIPTFASLIKKANMSVDMQIVRQMNTILQADEAVAGKPATVVQAKQILADNGCDDFTPTFEQNVYYWVGAENRVILWEKDEPVSASAMMMVVSADDGAETGKVTYPNDLAKKYKDLTEPSADWSDLSANYNVVVVEPAEGETLRTTLLNAVAAAEDGAILQLPKNATVDLGAGGLEFLGAYLKGNGGTGKTLTIDLNGGTIDSTTAHSNGYYYGLMVPVNGTLTLTNGNVKVTTNAPDKMALGAETGAHLILRGINMNTNGAAIWPSGDASEVVIEDSKIYTTGGYALGTTYGESCNVRIIINNSELTNASGTAVLCNVPSDVHISDSTITGVVHGIALRAGHVEIKDSTLVTTDTEPGIYAFDNFAQGYNFNGRWGGGNTIPAGVLVVGDYTKPNGDGSFNYGGDAEVIMVNTKLQSAAPTLLPEVLMAVGDPAKTVSVTYDAASSVGRTVVYGDVWNGQEDNLGVVFAQLGTIKVNGTVVETKICNAIPDAVGTFAAGTEHSVSELNKVYRTIPQVDFTEDVKAYIEENWAVDLSETEWATAKLSFSSGTRNQLKNITYTNAEGTETKIGDGCAVGGKRITLNFGNLHFNASSSGDAGWYNYKFAGMDFVQDEQSLYYLATFKANCATSGVKLTDAQWENAKIVIGSTANCIVDIKY